MCMCVDVFRLAAITCLCAHTGCHPQQTDARGLVPDPAIETAVLGLLACILPGVLAALQDVAMSDNPGHAVVVVRSSYQHRSNPQYKFDIPTLLLAYFDR